MLLVQQVVRHRKQMPRGPSPGTSYPGPASHSQSRDRGSASSSVLAKFGSAYPRNVESSARLASAPLNISENLPVYTPPTQIPYAVAAGTAAPNQRRRAADVHARDVRVLRRKAASTAVTSPVNDFSTTRSYYVYPRETTVARSADTPAHSPLRLRDTSGEFQLPRHRSSAAVTLMPKYFLNVSRIHILHLVREPVVEFNSLRPS